jgi:abhydrolase domain-containing protein 17
MRQMLTALLALLAAYGAFALFAWLVADRIIFLPPAASYDTARLPHMHVATEDGARIAVLHLPHQDARFTLLYSHGNAEDLGHLSPLLEMLHDAGFAILAYDYRGYGTSTGGPATAHGASRDHEAVYRHATAELGIAPSRIILYGRSVGSGPATELAARAPVGGLILESPFTSTFAVVTRVRLLPFDRFDNLLHIRSVHAPVLIIHGTDDEVIPVAHGRRLYDAAPGPKQSLWLEGARHNDIMRGEQYVRALAAFTALVERTAGPE